MLCDYYIPWLSLFAGIVVYKVGEDGKADDNGGFINIDEFIKRFEQSNLRLGGIQYQKGSGREEELNEAIINNAGDLCELGLMERKRGMMPPRLEYRVTTKGRKYDNLSRSRFGLFRCKMFFFGRCIWQRIKKYKFLITGAAFAMATINAVRFYNLAFTWVSETALAIVSTLGLFLSVILIAYASSK